MWHTQSRASPPPLHLSASHVLDQETGESYWEEPGEPYRPMIRDRLTGALIQAWPQLERELLEVRCCNHTLYYFILAHFAVAKMSRLL